MKPKRDWNIFFASVFFVLGFSSVFSLLGVLLRTILLNSSYTVQEWLGYLGGVIIIAFGLFTLGLFTPAFLQREHKFAVKNKFHSQFLTSFVFGAAFAVGWTPCVSAALGAILALASTQPSSAFFLLFAYTMGIGIPFLLVGVFTAQAEAFIARAGRGLLYFQYFFGVILIVLGVLIFTSQLNRIANFEPLVGFFERVGFSTSTNAGETIESLNLINMGIALFAGFASFLSPCVLPIMPGFLSYLASTAVKKDESQA
ncbi:MAG: cytochrome c biogenesis protein CcdA [Patescibacteria group bacterium]